MRNSSNTGRIRHLLSLFPEAKIVHVFRNPYAVCAAQRERWSGLLSLWSLQNFDLKSFDEYTFSFYEMMMQRVFDQKGLVPEQNFLEVRYEDLVANPIQTTRQLYQRLQLPVQVEAYREIEKLPRYLPHQTAWRWDRHSMNAITHRLGFAIDELGYSRR